MKSTSRLLPISKTLIFLILLTCLCNFINAQNIPEMLKIGTYDSRIVTLAYSRSDQFIQRQMKLRNEEKELMQSNDTTKMAEAAYRAVTEQYLAHQRVFCSGSASSILDLVKDKLPQVAQDAGVSAIVSKWELTFVDPSAEIVDLTMVIANLYNPKENIEKMATELAKQAPIPLEEFTVEEVIEMWKQFESKYLGKK